MAYFWSDGTTSSRLQSLHITDNMYGKILRVIKKSLI